MGTHADASNSTPCGHVSLTQSSVVVFWSNESEDHDPQFEAVEVGRVVVQNVNFLYHANAVSALKIS